MKIALIITDGLEQIVLTPKDKSERALIDRIHNSRTVDFHKAAFYETVGNYYRYGDEQDEKSTIITLRPASSVPANRWEPEVIFAMTKEQRHADEMLLIEHDLDPKTLNKTWLITQLCRLIRKVEGKDADQ